MAARKGLSGVVRKVCLWCQGKSWQMVRECTQSDCPLHSSRLADEVDDAVLLGRVHAFCVNCAGSVEAVAACTADQTIGGHDPCPAHPFRTGENLLLTQKIRTLPGLAVSRDAQEKRPAPAGEEEGGQDRQALRPEAKPSAPAMCRVAFLPFLDLDRVPEAPDI